MEEKHKCKLCSRTFAHGRSLGGHMKAHFATLPLPPKPPPPPPSPPSPLFSCSSSQDSDDNALIYGLRENPKKSFRLADPEFSFVDTTAGSVIIQDRESESELKNPTRLLSMRTRTQRLTSPKRLKPSLSESPPPTKPEPASSVSETSAEEDVAMCLIMLSRDEWKRNSVKEEEDRDEKSKRFKEIEVKKGVRGKHQCEKCRKTFRSFRALGSHRNVCFREEEEEARNAGNKKNNNNDSIFECPFCYKVFGSGQALGGHKRSHLVQFSSSTLNDSATLVKQSFIDLNLPVPVAAAATAEDELSSVVSDS